MTTHSTTTDQAPRNQFDIRPANPPRTFPSFPLQYPSLPLEVGPLNTARGYGGALQASPAGCEPARCGAEPQRKSNLDILASKSDIGWHQI